jgi:hypothetical protein
MLALRQPGVILLKKLTRTCDLAALLTTLGGLGTNTEPGLDEAAREGMPMSGADARGGRRGQRDQQQSVDCPCDASKLKLSSPCQRRKLAAFSAGGARTNLGGRCSGLRMSAASTAPAKAASGAFLLGFAAISRTALFAACVIFFQAHRMR